MSDQPFDPITRLNAALEGRYRIESELGEGGMATVYLAEDLKHERKVALKVLKPELAAVVGAERFLAEIKTTANLSHPHILPLHDSGDADGFLFYVMPYVEGESLRERLDRDHQLPVDDAVRIATNVAEALEYAHSHGVIHRDIKPANILLQAGKPVISDFGIALAVGTAGQGRLTETGLSVGTPHYMSPEQATGDQSVGPATDIYALGAVLYEMLVGEPPYTGSTAQAILGRIIAGELATATKQRASVPTNVDAAIRKALEKLPADRFASAQDFAKALADPGFRYGDVAVGAGVGGGLWNALSITTAGLAVVSTVLAGWLFFRPEPPGTVARFSSPFEEGQRPVGLVAFAADGSGLVYRGPGPLGRGAQLQIRRWADLAATPIRGTEDVVSFVLSPDGRDVAFASYPGPLRVVPLDGGPSRTVVEEVLAVWDWDADGTFFFTGVTPAVLGRASATRGGEAVETLSEFRENETLHGYLRRLPGGKMGVFEVWYSPNGEDAEVWAIDLDTRERWVLTAGSNPRYASTGHLLFGTMDGALMAVRIDPATAELSGSPVAVAEGLVVDAQTGNVRYAVSESGTLIYLGGGATSGLAELVWVTRSGDSAPVEPGWSYEPPSVNYGWSLSPDGSRVALTSEVDGNVDVWIKQLGGGPFERLTFDDAIERDGVWSADGEFVTYVRDGSMGSSEVWRRRSDGTGEPERLIQDERGLSQGRWDADGERMVYRTDESVGAFGERDIVSFRPGVDHATTPLIASAEFAEQGPSLSPDGRWLAYTSSETGQEEVYVRPFPDVDSGKVRVSTDRGESPRWANNSNELFFIDADRRLIAARFETSPSFRVLQREALFTVGPEYVLDGARDIYDVAPDDQRFLMGRAYTGSGSSSGSPRFILVQNWFEELKRLVPN